MAPPSSLPAALLQRAAAAPEEPWLFRAKGWDWVWHPWRELAGWMERWREALSPLPAGSRAAFRYDASPESVILDLALQAAGLVSAPNGKREDSCWIERRGLEIEIDAGAGVIPGGRPVEWTIGEIA
ncbi:MAG TPA: hypothetical protein VIJ61_04465, partial [Thermoanaerobaculia bacterium]